MMHERTAHTAGGQMEEQFNLIAGEYDRNRRRFIPCFDEFYEGTTAFLAANMGKPGRLLDLGAGTGLLTAFWLRYFPEAAYILVDVAEDMLKIARERFAHWPNVQCRLLDYAQELPAGPFDVVMSALSIHHLEEAGKQELFERIWRLLPAGGLLVNYDQFCAGGPRLSRWYDAYWEGRLSDSGLLAQDLALWRQRRTLDRECSVGLEETMLRQAGFCEVQCVYACQKFAVIAAVK